MKLRCLQVKNFRCVEDSSEFSVCPVTCLVGKNGAGKTSVLEALYKLNPDVQELSRFDVLMEYPRARRRQYQKRTDGKADDALITTWELDDKDVEELESALGRGAVKSRAVVIRKGYYPERRWSGAISDHDTAPAEREMTPIKEVKARTNVLVEEQVEATTGASTGEAVSNRVPITPPPQPLEAPLTKGDDAFYEQHVAKLLPKLLYFSEWHMMQGRISIDALLERKQKGELTGPDRVFMALLELGGTSVEAISRIERSEELIADLEDAALPVTEEIARYWSQERDLRISFHLYPGRPQDPSPLDRGLVFETRIVNTRTNLSLNFEERSTGFVWFFSFLVWYSDVRRRYGDNLLIILDDPGLGLHAKAQWDLLEYICEKLAPLYQIVYATHSPFMVNPDRMQWVRTVEEITREAPEGTLDHVGTKVGDEVLSTDHDTLLPLQASLGYRLMQDMAGRRRLLLVEKPADVIYLHWFSARLKAQGRRGLNPCWTLIPGGSLTRLATMVGLLAKDTASFAVLLTMSEQHPDVVGRRELSRMLEACHCFPLRGYAKPVESTVEDLIGPVTYPALVDLSYRVSRKRRLAQTLNAVVDKPILKQINEAAGVSGAIPGDLDPMVPAEYLLRSGGRKLRKLAGIEKALNRFEALFDDIDASL